MEAPGWRLGAKGADAPEEVFLLSLGLGVSDRGCLPAASPVCPLHSSHRAAQVLGRHRTSFPCTVMAGGGVGGRAGGEGRWEFISGSALPASLQLGRHVLPLQNHLPEVRSPCLDAHWQQLTLTKFDKGLPIPPPSTHPSLPRSPPAPSPHSARVGNLMPPWILSGMHPVCHKPFQVCMGSPWLSSPPSLRACSLPASFPAASTAPRATSDL